MDVVDGANYSDLAGTLHLLQYHTARTNVLDRKIDIFFRNGLNERWVARRTIGIEPGNSGDRGFNVG